MWKKILIVSGAVLLSFVLFVLWYGVTYAMDEVSTEEFNDSSLSDKVLIATQGSKYKNKVVDEVVNQLKDKPIYIKVMDVSHLDQIKEEEWNAIVILHTWENWKPEPHSTEFVERSNDKSKLFVISTSGSGDNHLDDVDGITSASNLDEVTDDAKKIVSFVEKCLLVPKPEESTASGSALRFQRSWFSSIRR